MVEPQSTLENQETSTLAEYLRERGDLPVKLNLGCGGMQWKDFINVDLFPDSDSGPDSSRDGCVADVFADIRNLGLEDDCVDEIFSAHVLEHFTRWEAVAMLRDWFRMLSPGGVVRVEAPSFWRCVSWLFHPSRKKRRLARTQFYGNQWDELDYETHRYVWGAKELATVFRELGYVEVSFTHRTWTHHPGRDLRVEGRKPQ